MTQNLETEAHGTIASGFSGAFTQFIRMGEYAFTTVHFCHLTKNLASHPDARAGIILAYDERKFWERGNEYISKLLLMLSAKQYLPKFHRAEIDRQLTQDQGKISIDDDVDMHDEGQFIPVQVHDDRTISIGQYRISSHRFGTFAFYVAHGGLFGWQDGQKPDFAESTMEAIKGSKNPLFEEIQKELAGL